MSKKRKVKVLGTCPTHGTTVRDEQDGKVTVVRPMKDGEPLQPDESFATLEYDAEGNVELEMHDVRPRATSSGKPGYYATDESRASWDRMFGGKKQKKGAPN